MAFSDMHDAIRARVTEAVEAQDPVPAVAWDNAEFEPPSGAVWVRATILPGESQQVTLGLPARYRTAGVVVLSLFDDVGRGDGRLLALADGMVPFFRSVSSGGVLYRTPAIEPVGAVGELYQKNLSCPWIADEDGAEP